MMKTKMRMRRPPASLSLESVNFLDISTLTTAQSLVQTTFRPHKSLLSPSYHYCLCASIQLYFGHLPILRLHCVKITTYLDRHFRIIAIFDENGFLACYCRHPKIILILGINADLSFFPLPI